MDGEKFIRCNYFSFPFYEYNNYSDAISKNLMHIFQKAFDIQ